VQDEAADNRATEAKSRRNIVSDGVLLGYQVIDTYLKQGQKIARQFVAAMPYSAGTGNGHSEEPDIRSVQLLTELMANWSDLVGAYTEALTSRNESIRPPQPSHENRPAEAPRSTTPAVQLAYEITSRRPALVDVQFFPGRQTLELASHGLRCLGSSAAEIAVMFEQQPDHQRTVISIHVPDDQPEGLYTGTLMDSHSGSVVGSVSLRIR
jgi:hypothetical protein